MARVRVVSSVVISCLFIVSTALGASAPPVGTITAALGAHIGAASATAGATVFGGDKLSTQQDGNLQIRAGSARLMLSGSSIATIAGSDSAASATLQQGTVLFSTANAKAFVLHASKAEIRPDT